MSIRTASTGQQRQSLLDLQALQERLSQNQSRLSSGQRLTSLAEDPAAAVRVLELSASIQANDGHLAQIDAASADLQATETALSAAVEDVTRLQELSVSGGAASASEVDGLLQNLLALANTQSQGRYLFSGTRSDVAPFGTTAPHAYQGSAQAPTLQVATGLRVATRLTGDQAFLGGMGLAPGASSADVFTAATTLATGLRSGDAAQIQQASSDLDAALRQLNACLADVGGRQASLERLKTTLSASTLSLQTLRSDTQDTDYAAAMSQLSSDQTVQAATLSAMAKIGKASLFDYLA